MLQFLKILRQAYGGLVAVFALQDKSAELDIEAAANSDLLSYIGANHPDLIKLSQGDVTSLSVQAVAYQYPLLKEDGSVMLDELHDPIIVREVHFRYVGAGTSVKSAVYGKLIDKNDFFESDKVEAEIEEKVGRDVAVYKDAFVEIKWSPESEFYDHSFEFGTRSIVANEKKRVDLLGKLIQVPSFDGRMLTVKTAQLDFEGAVVGSLALDEQVRLNALIGEKNAILQNLQDAVDDYESLRKEMAEQQGLQMVEFLLSWAGIAVGAAKAAEDKLKGEEMQSMWQGLGQKMSGIEEGMGELKESLQKVTDELELLNKPVPPSYDFNTIILIVPTSHKGVFPPVPLDGGGLL